MSVRFFKCDHCGHKMRLGADRCGYCHQTAPWWNTRLAHGVMGLVIVALLVVAIGFARPEVIEAVATDTETAP